MKSQAGWEQICKLSRRRARWPGPQETTELWLLPETVGSPPEAWSGTTRPGAWGGGVGADRAAAVNWGLLT